MDNLSPGDWLQLLATGALFLGIWLRLDSKFDALRTELKQDIKDVDDRLTRLEKRVTSNHESSNRLFLQIIERLTRVEEKVESVLLF